jgi:hypothetical protein
MAKRGRPKGTTTKGNPAAGQAEAETTSGYFRRVFKENPKLLGSHSNADLFNRWLADHPDHTEVPQNVKGILFNLKSVLRKKRRKKQAAPKTTHQAEQAIVVAAQPKPSRIALKGLEALEEHIDDALTLARSLDRESLDEVIQMLRRARNTVVWKLGE